MRHSGHIISIDDVTSQCTDDGSLCFRKKVFAWMDNNHFLHCPNVMIITRVIMQYLPNIHPLVPTRTETLRIRKDICNIEEQRIFANVYVFLFKAQVNIFAFWQ